MTLTPPDQAAPDQAAPDHTAPDHTAPDDARLTVQGLDARGDGRVLALSCGALAHEIIALKAMNGWSHLDLHCLPANLHLRPEKIPDAVEAAVHKFRPRYDSIFIVYADCGTGGLLQSRCDALGVQMIEGPHCYAFFSDFVAASEHEITAFYLTDFLVRQFEAFVWRPMGFDKHPELIDMMFGNYEKMIYLAQTDNADLDRLAQGWAQRMNLQYERRLTGYGDLAGALAQAASRG